MNIYQKLLLARCKFQERNVKKSGRNDYSGYDFFDLKDIVPVCNSICAEIMAVCLVNFFKEQAVLSFVDCENPESHIEFVSPMSSANLKGCHEVQNLGAVQTYLKRYLYQHCFEIAEQDSLDGVKKFTIDVAGVKLINYIWEHKAELGGHYLTALNCFHNCGDCEEMYHRCVKYLKTKEEREKTKNNGDQNEQR